jgi:hypothetical protein
MFVGQVSNSAKFFRSRLSVRPPFVKIVVCAFDEHTVSPEIKRHNRKLNQSSAGLEIVFQNCVAPLRYETEIASHLLILHRNFIFIPCVHVQSFFMFAVLQDYIQGLHLTTVYCNFVVVYRQMQTA